MFANQADYNDRGWCFCEANVGNLVKNQRKVLDLGRFSGEEEDLRDLSVQCRAGRAPPMLPNEFARLLQFKSFTSKKADLQKVNAIYEQAFRRRIGEAETLQFAGLAWGDEEAKALSLVLFAATALQRLFLAGNRFGDEGVAALATCLREGAAPALTYIELQANCLQPLKAAELQALREARDGLVVE